MLEDTNTMREFCTCGAKLPEAARFCHKCGKPQFEVEPEQEPVVVEEVRSQPVAPPPPPEISFRNIAAVRIGFLIASLALFGSMLAAFTGSMPFYLLAVVILTPASGFLAVWLYTKRTGQVLSIRSGAKLGFIVGVFSFVFSTVMTTISTLTVASRVNLLEQYKEQLGRQGLPPETVEQMISMLEEPGTLVFLFLFGMAISFLIGTTVASVGGALGAKVLEKD